MSKQELISITVGDLLEQVANRFPDKEAVKYTDRDYRRTWREYALVEGNPLCHYRREITWRVFDEKANRVANMLLARGIKKGDKVGILLMNCLEWLPIYFGILKSGAMAVPLLPSGVLMAPPFAQ